MKKLKAPKATPYNQGKQKRSKETFAFILEAATLILAKRPDDFTTNKIAEEAGMSIGHFYQFFPNKEAVIDAIFEQQLKKDREKFKNILSANKVKTLSKAIGLTMDIVSEINRRSPELKKALWSNMGTKFRQELVKQIHLENTKDITELFKNCSDWDELKDPSFLSVIILSSCASVLNFNNETQMFRNDQLIDQLRKFYASYARTEN